MSRKIDATSSDAVATSAVHVRGRPPTPRTVLPLQYGRESLGRAREGKAWSMPWCAVRDPRPAMGQCAAQGLSLA
jgi:hypothetical protein